MLRAFAQHHVLTQRQLQRSLHSSFNASTLPIRCEGLYRVVRNVHGSTTSTSREGGDSPGEKPSTEQPGVRVTVDLTGCEDYVKKFAKLKKEAGPWWLQFMSEMRSEPNTARFLELARGWPGWSDFMKEARASASGFNSGAAHGSDTQAQSSPAWDAQKVAPSLYRAFLQECQSPTQGSVGSLVKRLVDKAHKHEHLRLTQALDEKEQLLQEQASQLDAMTADRDKWMMDHQQLVASARQQGKMTEAQLRAAASVASKRADDEALYAHQKVTELKQQLGRQEEPKSTAKGPAATPGPTPTTVPKPAGVGIEAGMDGQDLLHKLQSVQADSAQLVKLVAEDMAELLSQHPQVNHLIGREVSIVTQLSQLISAQLEAVPADLRHFIDMHHRVAESSQLMEDELNEMEQRCADAERDLEAARLKLAKRVSQIQAKSDNDGADHSDLGNSDEVKALREENLKLCDQVDKLFLDLKQYKRLYGRLGHRELDGSGKPLKAELEQPEGDHPRVVFVSHAQQRIEELFNQLREAQREADECARLTLGRYDLLESDDSSGDDFEETDSEDELEGAEAQADGAEDSAISESVYATLKAGMSRLGASASQEQQLKKHVAAMGDCSRRCADSQDHLQQAVDRHLFMVEDAQGLLESLVDEAQESLAIWRTAFGGRLKGSHADVEKAEHTDEMLSRAAEEAAVELSDHVAEMYRSRPQSRKPHCWPSPISPVPEVADSGR